MSKRTTFDFSNHTHRVEIFTSREGNEIRVDHLREGASRMGYVKFVNDNQGLSVFGDFGNWIFCRPFHPSEGGRVSDRYWDEKLSIASCQECEKFDSDATRRELTELINGGLEGWGYEEKDLGKAKEWLTELLDYVDDELEYTYEAFRGENPTEMDFENIPFRKKRLSSLEVVYDAFEEICSRMRNNP